MKKRRPFFNEQQLLCKKHVLTLVLPYNQHNLNLQQNMLYPTGELLRNMKDQDHPLEHILREYLRHRREPSTPSSTSMIADSLLTCLQPTPSSNVKTKAPLPTSKRGTSIIKSTGDAQNHDLCVSDMTPQAGLRTLLNLGPLPLFLIWKSQFIW